MENHSFIRLECIDGAYCQKRIIRFILEKTRRTVEFMDDTT